MSAGTKANTQQLGRKVGHKKKLFPISLWAIGRAQELWKAHPCNKHQPVVDTKRPYDPSSAEDSKPNGDSTQYHKKDVDRNYLAASIIHVDEATVMCQRKRRRSS